MTKEEFLDKLFEKSGIDINFRFDRDEILEELSLEKDTYNKFANYWVGKGLLHGPNPTSTGSHMTLYFNSSGIDHVEDLINSQNKPNKNTSMQEAIIKIFVSHKSSDIELTKSLVKLFTSSLKIDNEEIRCTSVPGFRLDAGVNSNDAIRKEVNESALLVSLLTPESLKSSFVLFELGARWGVMKPLIPLLAHGADFNDLPAPIRDKNAVKLEKEEDLHDLIDSISKLLDISSNKITSYQDEFYTVIEHAIKKK